MDTVFRANDVLFAAEKASEGIAVACDNLTQWRKRAEALYIRVAIPDECVVRGAVYKYTLPVLFHER